MPEPDNKLYEYAKAHDIDGLTTFAIRHNEAPVASIVCLTFYREEQYALRQVTPFEYPQSQTPPFGPVTHAYHNLVQHYNQDLSSDHIAKLIHAFPRILTGVLNQPKKKFDVPKQRKWQTVSNTLSSDIIRISRFAGSNGQIDGIAHFPFADIECINTIDRKKIEIALPVALRILSAVEEDWYKRAKLAIRPLPEPTNSLPKPRL